MKKFLTTSFILLALVFGALGAFVPSAQAVDGPLLPLPGDLGADIVPARTPAPAVAAPASAAPGATVNKTEEETPTNLPNDPDAGFGWIMSKIMSLFAWLVGVAAITLDNAVYMTVVTMGSYVNDMEAIGITWRILRDVGNILLIFGFIAIGISIILNTEKLGYGKKALPMLLVAAVFLNFSLFISEAIIDTGNLFATQFYTQINGGQPAGSKEFAPGEVANEGISNKIMGKLGMQTIYGNAITNTEVFKGANSTFIGFMGILLFLVLAFVMFSLAFILIARFVILVFLIILSPVAFAGYAIPKLQSSASKWWHELIQQTITAPVLMLLLYIALRVITDTSFLTGYSKNNPEGIWTGFVNGTNLPGFAGILLSFLIAMGLLLGVVILSKRLSAFGAAGATKLAGKLSFGVAGWGLNRTVGRVAHYSARGLRQSAAFNKFDAFTGRAISKGLDRTATGSFDIRGVKAGGGLGALGVDAGKASDGGFSGARERSIKDHKEATKRIEDAYKDKGSERFQEVVKSENAVALRGAQEKQLAARQAQEKARAEVDRINKLPETTDQTLAELQKSENELTAANEALAEATKNVAIATRVKADAEKDIVKAADDRMKKDISASKTAYVEGLTAAYNNWWNPIGYIAYGPSSGAAARKIKESLREPSDEKKFADLAKKIAKEGEGKGMGTTAESKPTEESANGVAPAGPLNH